MRSGIGYVCGLALLAILVSTNILWLLSDPVQRTVAELQETMSRSQTVSAETVPEYVTIGWAKQRIAARQDLWSRLIPAHPPPPGCGITRFGALEDVRVERAQIGDKVKVIYSAAPGGAYLPLGALVNGWTISGISRGAVEFTWFWEEGDRYLKYTIPREQR